MGCHTPLALWIDRFLPCRSPLPISHEKATVFSSSRTAATLEPPPRAHASARAGAVIEHVGGQLGRRLVEPARPMASLVDKVNDVEHQFAVVVAAGESRPAANSQVLRQCGAHAAAVRLARTLLSH